MSLQIRNGDTVLVRLKVDDHDPMSDDVVLFRDVDGDLFNVLRSDIVSVEPRALQVGDRVTWGTGVTTWELRAIVDNVKAVVYLNGSYRIEKFSDLRLAD